MQTCPLTTRLDLAGCRHRTQGQSTVRCHLRSKLSQQEDSREKAEDLSCGVKVFIGLRCVGFLVVFDPGQVVQWKTNLEERNFEFHFVSKHFSTVLLLKIGTEERNNIFLISFKQLGPWSGKHQIVASCYWEPWMKHLVHVANAVGGVMVQFCTSIIIALICWLVVHNFIWRVTWFELPEHSWGLRM